MLEVSDLDAARRFYRDTLGFEETLYGEGREGRYWYLVGDTARLGLWTEQIGPRRRPRRSPRPFRLPGRGRGDRPAAGADRASAGAEVEGPIQLGPGPRDLRHRPRRQRGRVLDPGHGRVHGGRPVRRRARAPSRAPRRTREPGGYFPARARTSSSSADAVARAELRPADSISSRPFPSTRQFHRHQARGGVVVAVGGAICGPGSGGGAWVGRRRRRHRVGPGGVGLRRRVGSGVRTCGWLRAWRRPLQLLARLGASVSRRSLRPPRPWRRSGSPRRAPQPRRRPATRSAACFARSSALITARVSVGARARPLRRLACDRAAPPARADAARIGSLALQAGARRPCAVDVSTAVRLMPLRAVGAVGGGVVIVATGGDRQGNQHRQQRVQALLDDASGHAPGPHRVQVCAQLLELVADPGRLLEAEVLGGGEHLLLQLDDQLLQLLRGLGGALRRGVRRRRRGARDSIARNSVMSEIPFWTVSGVIPCSLL